MKIPPFDYRSITDTIQRSLATAGLQRESNLMRGVTATVENALATAGLMSRNDDTYGQTIEGEAREVPSQGQFTTHSFTNHAGTRSYKLYVPQSVAPDTAAPLVVMLHGCSQNPDDFAAGTQMNTLAEQHGFLVAYPAQSRQANKSGCWKWYSARDQEGGMGEPAILAGITREVMSRHRIDAQRVFVAGMSAGGAMAVILGATHPELFAAVGAHSALPYGAARDVQSALVAMKGGGTSRAARAIPTIVFHGSRDATVNVRNGAAIIEQATGQGARPTDEHTGRSPDGRRYSRTVYTDAAGRTTAEYWVLEGAGHAWSGGSTRGSFTDAGGPDASAEMIRFFLGRHQIPTRVTLSH